MDELVMDIRSVDESERVVVGIVAPYDEVTFLTPTPEGERIRRSAFRRSLDHRETKVPLLRNHERTLELGRSRRFTDTADGLVGEFVVHGGPHGDALLDDTRNGYLPSMSVGFQPVRVERGSDGVREVLEARLVEVSLVAVPAYAGAAMLAVRNAQDLDELLAPFGNRPTVDLSPIPPVWR